MVQGCTVYNERGFEIIRISLDNVRQLGFEHGSFSQTRKIMKVAKNGADDDTVLQDSMTGKCSTRSTSMLLADLVDVHSTTKLVSGEPRAICFNDYCEGEILCWSQNSIRIVNIVFIGIVSWPG